ncbi:MAG TPA: hypothetical protein VEK33_08585 [Terriglobales bacterium]|nr:hypothetical protein [Terriglobales bacterium]
MNERLAKAVLPLRRVFACVLPSSPGVIATFVLCSVAFAQSSADPQELVRQAVGNELASPFLPDNCSYQYHREGSGRHETLLMVKSSDLVVGKLVRINNAPPSRDQEQKENDRLRRLLHDSDLQQQQRRKQQKFEHYVRELVAALPQAFHYTETETEAAADGRRLIHLAFQPAPDFHPATTELELLRGMAGAMVIDDQRKRIVRLAAHTFREMDFGWGLLIHLNKGANLLLEREAAPRLGFDLRAFSVTIEGRILLLKKLEVHWSFDHFASLGRTVDLASAVGLLTAPDLAGSGPGLLSH